MKWTLREVRWTLKSPVTTSAATVSRRDAVLVKLEHEGTVGLGEASPLMEFGGEPFTQCRAALEESTRQLARAPTGAADVERLLERAPGLRNAPAARFAVEQAMLDWVAKRMGLPLRKLLSPGAARELAVNALLVSNEPHALRGEAATWRERGFSTLKLKVGGRSPAEDLLRVRAVREGAGLDAKIRLDANGAWDVEKAAHALRLLGEVGLELCEQPTPVRDPDALGEVARRKLCPVAADEGLVVAASREALAREADVLVLKPALLGGLLPALALGRKGRAAYVTAGYEGPIARAGAAHLAAALPRSKLAHGLHTGALLEKADSPLDAVRGALKLPEAPGLGLGTEVFG
ncbi:MAG: o-succinylbenzoate synthase [Deltaproteobacteria bacterium]|nr:o-succinylbenzoate synthase [Deltaproteobacteria bacterium]